MDNQCYKDGSIVGAVLGTFFCTLVLGGLIWYLWERRRKRQSQNPGSTLAIVEEGDGGKQRFQYDNPGFAEDTTDNKKGSTVSMTTDGVQMNKKMKEDGNKAFPWGPLSFLFKSRNALDDSVIDEPQVYTVGIKGHDFTGLGFSICGNMRDGIFVKDIMQRGPAFEGKRIQPGDRIMGMTVSFKQMVLEDAITLLSYASPYEVNLEMLRMSEKSLPHKGIMLSPSNQMLSNGLQSPMDRVCHPFFKSQSIDDLRKVGKEHMDLKNEREKKMMKEPDMKKDSMIVDETDGAKTSSMKGKSKEKKCPKCKADKKCSKCSPPMMATMDVVDATPKDSKVRVITIKPNIIPRAKAKIMNVKKSAPVEAISPVVKLSMKDMEDDEMKLNFEMKVPEKPAVVIDMENPVVEMASKPSSAEQVMIEMPEKMQMQMDTEMDKMTKSENIEVKSPHVEFQMPPVEMSSSEMKKPDRKMTKKEKSDAKKSDQMDKEMMESVDKSEKPSSSSSSVFGKIAHGLHLPDINLKLTKKVSISSEEPPKEKTEEELEMERQEKAKAEEEKKKMDMEKEEERLKMEMEKEAEKKKLEAEKEEKRKQKELEKEEKKKLEHEKRLELEKKKEERRIEKEKERLEKEKMDKEKAEKERIDKLEKEKQDKAKKAEKEKEKSMKLKAKEELKAKEMEEKEKMAQMSMKEKEKSPTNDGEMPETSMKKMSESSTEVDQIMSDSEGGGTEKVKKPKFQMPTISIKLPKFGHSKQTYSLENSDMNESSLGGSGGKGESTMMISSTSSSEINSMASDLKLIKSEVVPDKSEKIVEKMLPLQAEMKMDVDMKMPQMSMSVEKTAEKTEKMEQTTSTQAQAESMMPVVVAEGETMDKDKEMKDKEKSTGFMSKGLQSLKELKDKVAHKLSIDHTTDAHDMSNKDKDKDKEMTPEDPNMMSDKDEDSKRERKSKKEKDREARDKSIEAKLKEKEEKAKEKARLKAEKKQMKDLKKKASSSSSADKPDHDMSESSSSDESDDEKDQKSQKMKDPSGGGKKEKKSSISLFKKKSEKVEAADSTEQKQPVAPSRSKDDKKSKKDKEKMKDKDKDSSSSSESDGDEKDKDKPKKPKRSNKRKAPSVPPPPAAPETANSNKTTVITSVEVNSPPKDMMDEVQVVQSSNNTTKTPESGRKSASFGDLPSLHVKADPGGLSERTVSLDMTSEDHQQIMSSSPGGGGVKINLMSPVEDLSAVSNSNIMISTTSTKTTIIKPDSHADATISSSSSSETLKASSPSAPMMEQKPQSPQNEGDIHKMMQETVSMMNNIVDKMDGIGTTTTTTSKMPKSVTIDPMMMTMSKPEGQMMESQVTISTSGSSIMEDSEVQKVAEETVNDIISKASGSESSAVQMPITSKNVTVMNISSSITTMDQDHEDQSQEQDQQQERGKVEGGMKRGSSKTRLLQTVADANEIKINPIKATRRDSSTSSSSSSSSSSESHDVEGSGKSNGGGINMSSTNNRGMGQTIEISSSELDNVMMSHADFLVKQQASKNDHQGAFSSGETDSPSPTADIMMSESPPKEPSFDNWIYVDRDSKESHSSSHCSDPSSNEDDDTTARNGGLSPTTFNVETKFDTSEIRVTHSPLPVTDPKMQTKVYSTTMTLPQKSITQIVLGQDSDPTIRTNGGVIVSKITLDPTPSPAEDSQNIANLPKLEPLKK